MHARGVLGALLPPVMGSLLEHSVPGRPTRRVYLSGDTLTGEHVTEIRRRHGDIDVAVLHLGGTRVLWHTVTMDAAQGVDFLHRVQPGQAIPVHHDDYRVFRSPLPDFEELAAVDGLSPVLTRVRRGETVELRLRAPD